VVKAQRMTNEMVKSTMTKVKTVIKVKKLEYAVYHWSTLACGKEAQWRK
jgi:hypothetical protein